jgi:glycerol kinase
MPQYIMSIDQGTTGTTAALMDHGGRLVAEASVDYPQIFPRAGWVEHDPEEIWRSVTHTIGQVLKQSGTNPKDISAIGITNQRETTVIWDRATHKPIANAIVWQCRRTAEFCDKLKKAGKEKSIRQKTGLVLDPYFSATKFKWLLDNTPGARRAADKGALAGGTVDSFVLWRLTAGESHGTDVSNASRTMLMNIEKREWDKDLLKLFHVPLNLLPEIRTSSGIFGRTKGVPGLPDGIPIAGIAGDQQAALFGQAGFDVGDAKCTFGTGSFLLLNTGSKLVRSKSGLLTTVAWQLHGDKKMTYALEGGAFVCGAAVQWLRDGLGVISSSGEVEELARQVPDAGGVEFVPALTGLGAPYWDPFARGLISGLTRGSTKAHLARATLDAMALQNMDILLAMQKDLGKKLRSIKVDGGATANHLLMQLQADYLGQSVLRPRVTESTSAGAAYLAGLGAGIWRDTSELRQVWQLDREFQSAISPAERKKRVLSWRRAVERAKGV